MNFSDAANAVSDAERTLRSADDVAHALARLLVGRLRKVGNGTYLSKLKHELRDFDSRTGRWK